MDIRERAVTGIQMFFGDARYMFCFFFLCARPFCSVVANVAVVAFNTFIYQFQWIFSFELILFLFFSFRFGLAFVFFCLVLFLRQRSRQAFLVIIFFFSFFSRFCVLLSGRVYNERNTKSLCVFFSNFIICGFMLLSQSEKEILVDVVWVWLCSVLLLFHPISCRFRGNFKTEWKIAGKRYLSNDAAHSKCTRTHTHTCRYNDTQIHIYTDLSTHTYYQLENSKAI